MTGAALLALALLAAPAAAASPGAPAFHTTRYEEDWSVLAGADAVPRWQRAKYRPLDGSGAAWLSTGLEARLRYEGFDDNGWGAAEAPDDGYLWLRVMPHADLHAGPLRGFVQGIAAGARGVAPAAGPLDRTGVDLLQGFAELRLPLAGETSLMLRGGRALMALGSERLVGARYGPNVPLPFDGWRGGIAHRGARLDLLRLRPVKAGPGDFDDRSDGNRRLSGVYATLPVAGALSIDLYRFAYRREAGASEQGEGRERRSTLGLRLFGTAGPWSWNWEAMRQRGRFGDAPIRAWSIATETAFAAPSRPLRPLLRVRANIVSGDRDPADPTLQSFNPMFPKGKYFGELSPIGPYNIVNLHPALELDLGRGFGASLAGVRYWRQSRGDGIYDMGGALLRAGAGTKARHIGTQTEAVLTWTPHPLLSFSASGSMFAAGDFLRRTGPHRNIRMIALEAMFRL
ncbi:alginate export family protein [Allosphingosinicella deserti]|uniref:Alginate export domain-containing protein n=1 Tax=Allosphingosinicella deserti TaxID=2116704 RepID=A0A2P7QRR4_9SPHN|nr:alginate export family protein [Sphingomonas deserti]PSJ40652.1 hypothetical protein C7I55_10055 [Sphingomonas deserti]